MSEKGDANSGYRPEFVAALQLFARVSEAMYGRGLQRPILVGGAAAEFWSLSAVTTGDFDICTTRQSELEEEMKRAGLVRPSGAGAMLKGWIHPELRLGFEVVAEVPMDGNIEPARLRLIRPIGEAALFRVICVEDLRRPHGPVRLAQRAGPHRSGADTAIPSPRCGSGLS
ncbi:hypothetical protein [Novosphingobium clariflavum]|uniref:Nucleotidyl transferase AbiEii toxin, Type IV TA system n=1 Tax=Novosphingobium clariflavum TaxID=2029884 RepID=A0ABV6SC29_9SPHN|nr:hypothetical protein [Novosphingobium clariflavum]